MKTSLHWAVYAGLSLWLVTQSVAALDPQNSQLSLNGQPMVTENLKVDEQGFMRNTNSDGYFTFRDLDLRRDQACAMRLDMEFDKPMSRPGLFEVFWHEPKAGFRESMKGFVLINPADTAERKVFVIPLCKLFHYSGNINKAHLQAAVAGVRLDYPSNKNIGVKFHSIEFLDAQKMLSLFSEAPSNTVILEPYERLSPSAATSLDVLVPKLFFIFEEGLSRLWIDKGFLFFWLLLIVALKLLILRSYLRK